MDNGLGIPELVIELLEQTRLDLSDIEDDLDEFGDTIVDLGAQLDAYSDLKSLSLSLAKSSKLQKYFAAKIEGILADVNYYRGIVDIDDDDEEGFEPGDRGDY